MHLIDLNPALQGVMQRSAGWQQRLAQWPVSKVDASDGMYSGNDSYYLQTGISALNLIQGGLQASGRQMADVGSVMDYACGFGRVTRWLQAAFPKADLHAGDLDPKAVAAVSSLMQVPTTQLTVDLSKPLPRTFELIWVGSLATHLDEPGVVALLGFLAQSLAPGGVLVITTHGSYVAQRIRAREKLYNLDEADLGALLDQYDRRGYGFAAYPGQSDYGISINTPQRFASMAADAGLELVRFEKKGWVQHQDSFAFARAAA